MTARQDTNELMQRFASRGINLSFDEVNTLRRAELTLQRWAELECGDGNNYGAWMIVRDEETDKPFMEHHHYLHGKGKDYTTSTRIPDRERGALHRVDAICKAHGLHYYHQSDPRGCALYIHTEPMPDHDYTRGISCCV